MSFPVFLGSIFLIVGGSILLAPRPITKVNVEASWCECIRIMSGRGVMDCMLMACLLILVFGFFRMAALMWHQRPVQEH